MVEWTYALQRKHYDPGEGEVKSRRVISPTEPMDERYGLEYLHITAAELAALAAGNLLEVSISGDEYTLVIALATEAQ